MSSVSTNSTFGLAVAVGAPDAPLPDEADGGLDPPPEHAVVSSPAAAQTARRRTRGRVELLVIER
jgi:hypothetical protein